jgi:hypothetical protein
MPLTCPPALPACPNCFQVIYGDTDSIMVYTGSDNLAEVVKLGQQIKREVRAVGERGHQAAVTGRGAEQRLTYCPRAAQRALPCNHISTLTLRTTLTLLKIAKDYQRHC